MCTHLKLHTTQLKQLTQTKTRPLHNLNAYSDPPKHIKKIIVYNNEFINIIISDPNIAAEECKK